MSSFSEMLENGIYVHAATCARAGRRSSPVPTAITTKETKNLTVVRH